MGPVSPLMASAVPSRSTTKPHDSTGWLTSTERTVYGPAWNVSPGAKLRSRKHRLLGRGNAGEVRPQRAVEHVLLERPGAGVARPDGDGRLPPADHQVGEQRQVLHVVEVAVGEDDVVDPRQRRQLERRGQRPGVQRQGIRRPGSRCSGSRGARRRDSRGPRASWISELPAEREELQVVVRAGRCRAPGAGRRCAPPARSAPGEPPSARMPDSPTPVSRGSSRRLKSISTPSSIGRPRLWQAWRICCTTRLAGSARSKVLDLGVGLVEPLGELLDHPHRDLGVAADHPLERLGVDDQQARRLVHHGGGVARLLEMMRHLAEELARARAWPGSSPCHGRSW